MVGAQIELARRFAEIQGARATWLVPASNTLDVIAKIGLMGPTDRLVAFSDDFSDAFARLFRGVPVTLLADPDPDAFLAASGWGEGAAEEGGGAGVRELGWGDARLVAGPASYAYPSGRSSGRVFWFAPSIGGLGLRVPDLRELSRAARVAGAILIVDNTLPTPFGCKPLNLGAAVSLEALDRVAAGGLGRKVVAVSVARSVGGRGRRRLVRPEAEDAMRLLSLGLGDPDGPSPSHLLSDADLAALGDGLDTLEGRMQRHMDNAHAISEYLRCHPRVGRVFYPGLRTHADHAAAACVLEHGFGPAVDFSLTGSGDEAQAGRHRRFLSLCGVSGRGERAGGAVTRMGIVAHGDACYLRMFAGTDDPLRIVDGLDRALRLFCGPTGS